MIDESSGRLLRRLLGLRSTKPAYSDKDLFERAQKLIPYEASKRFNLGLLDIAAAYCHVGSPDCVQCPLRSLCVHGRLVGKTEVSTREEESSEVRRPLCRSGWLSLALERLGHECVFASDIDPQLQEVYRRNFPGGPAIHGDIREAKLHVPPHDVLCAGFPCQPFSKSGTQAGLRDETSGTLFHEIVDVLRLHNPSYVILENVGNFERHDGGRTWRIVKASLSRLGYQVSATDHVTSGGEGLLSPHHFRVSTSPGTLFCCSFTHRGTKNVFPSRNRKAETTMADVVQSRMNFWSMT